LGGGGAKYSAAASLDMFATYRILKGVSSFFVDLAVADFRVMLFLCGLIMFRFNSIDPRFLIVCGAYIGVYFSG